MINTWKTQRVRGGMGVLGLLLLVGLAAPGSHAAGPGPATTSQPASPMAPYQLRFGANTGTGITTFTSSVLDANAWEFGGLWVSCPHNLGTENCGGVTVDADHTGLLADVTPTQWNPDPQVGVNGIAPNTTGAAVYGQSYGQNGTGVYGESPSYLGGYFLAAAPTGTGLLGEADVLGGSGLGTIGVRGVSTVFSTGAGGQFIGDPGTGLLAESTNGTGLAASSSSGYGLLAQSVSGYGLTGITGGAAGVSGVGGQGVSYGGTFTATDNITGVGVYGRADGLGGIGSPIGVKGTTNAASGTSYGGQFSATAGTGVAGSSASWFGVWGVSSTGTGVYGHSSTSTAVVGTSPNGYGVVGVSGSGNGVRARSGSYIAAWVTSSSGYGLYAASSGPQAVYATTANKTPAYYALYADGDMKVNGSVTTANGTYNIVTTRQGERTLYTAGATQQVIVDEGTATLKDGHVVITVDPLYAQTVELGTDYRVFVTAKSANTAGLGVINQTATSFEIGELNGGQSNFQVDWRIEAGRRGHAKERLAPVQP